MIVKGQPLMQITLPKIKTNKVKRAFSIVLKILFDIGLSYKRSDELRNLIKYNEVSGVFLFFLLNSLTPERLCKTVFAILM